MTHSIYESVFTHSGPEAACQFPLYVVSLQMSSGLARVSDAGLQYSTHGKGGSCQRGRDRRIQYLSLICLQIFLDDQISAQASEVTLIRAVTGSLPAIPLQSTAFDQEPLSAHDRFMWSALKCPRHSTNVPGPGL